MPGTSAGSKININTTLLSRNAAEMQALQDSLDKIKTGLQPGNSKHFQVKTLYLNEGWKANHITRLSHHSIFILLPVWNAVSNVVALLTYLIRRWLGRVVEGRRPHSTAVSLPCIFIYFIFRQPWAATTRSSMPQHFRLIKKKSMKIGAALI